jgi:hypothetical protein
LKRIEIWRLVTAVDKKSLEQGGKKKSKKQTNKCTQKN